MRMSKHSSEGRNPFFLLTAKRWLFGLRLKMEQISFLLPELSKKNNNKCSPDNLANLDRLMRPFQNPVLPRISLPGI